MIGFYITILIPARSCKKQFQMGAICTISCLLLDFILVIICSGFIWHGGGVVQYTDINQSTALLLIDKMFGSVK